MRVQAGSSLDRIAHSQCVLNYVTLCKWICSTLTRETTLLSAIFTFVSQQIQYMNFKESMELLCTDGTNHRYGYVISMVQTIYLYVLSIKRQPKRICVPLFSLDSKRLIRLLIVSGFSFVHPISSHNYEISVKICSFCTFFSPTIFHKSYQSISQNFIAGAWHLATKSV